MRKQPYPYYPLLSALLCVAMICTSVRSTAVFGEIDTGTAQQSYDEPQGAGEKEASAQISSLQNKISEVADTLEEYQQEQKKLESEIKNAQNQKEQAQQQSNTVSAQITLTQKEIDLLMHQISLLQQDIIEKQAHIEEKQTEIDETYTLFKKRVKAKHMQDDGSVLGLLIGSDSFSQFLTRSEHMSLIAEHDTDMMNLLTVQRGEIEQAKTELEQRKQEVDQAKAIQDAKKKDLAAQYAEAQKMVHSAQADEIAFRADLEKNQAEQAKMKREIDNLYQQIKFIKTPYSGGSMRWPLPGHRTISSVYGSRFGGTDFHTGLDITGPGCHGAPIVAVNDGTVSFVNTAYTNGSGYGMYVIVDHGVKDGQNITTLYGHCSSILVSPGQKVTAGQTIALVGSTGWSTGPHLHFEVRLGTQSVNPASYIGL